MNTDTSYVARRRTWLFGGVALLVSAALTMVHSQGMPSAFLLWSSQIAFAAALALLAVGWGVAGSITGRAIVGTSAVILVGIFPLATALFWSVFPQPDPTAIDIQVMQLIEMTRQALAFAIALIAVVAIGRARVIPAPWNWAPAWSLGAVTAAQLLVTAISVTAAPDLNALMLFSSFAGLLKLAAAIFLGVLAIVLAVRREPTRTVIVYNG